MRTETKDRIASKFLEHPLLHMLVRALLFSVWFRVSFIAFLCFPIVLLLALAKIWRTTPDGILPLVRISGVDWLQARSLRRTALREIAAGRVREGILSYDAAIGNNAANVEFVREYLHAIAQHVEPPEFQGPALGRAFWLLRLTQTNLVDLELAGTVFEKYGLDQYLIDLLQPRREQLTEPLQRTYLRALFRNGRIREFDQFWRSNARSDSARKDPEIMLYRAAYIAGWGTGTPSESDGLRLDTYLDDPQMRVSANRLYLLVCERRNEVDQYMTALRRLQDWKKDRVVDHVRAWRLLSTAGRREEAIELARSFKNLPATALETAQLAQAFYSLGLREYADKLLDRFVVEFSFLDSLWVLYGDLLIESQRWDKLRQLALSIRLNNDVRERLGDYGYYLEGRVELAQNRVRLAEEAFAKIGLQRVVNPALALAIAQGLQRLGYAQAARPLLSGLEKQGETNPAYWETLIGVAFELKDQELLLRAATRAFELNSRNWIAKNNFAAALLINRTNAPDAIQQTFQLAEQFPDDLSIRINHGSALAQNHRYDEADRLLAGIQPRAITDSERALYNLACAETLFHQRRLALARSFAEQIDANHLFPNQREFLAQLRAKLDEVTVRSPGRSEK